MEDITRKLELVGLRYQEGFLGWTLIDSDVNFLKNKGPTRKACIFKFT